MIRHVWCKQPRRTFTEIIHKKPYSDRGRENRYIKVLNIHLADILNRGEIKRYRKR
jgi:hypothetical protein